MLNRFCAQAAIGQPLTVHGKGGQTRGFLDIRDTVACLRLALDHPADIGEYRVFNQFTEQFSVKALAEKVREARQSHSLPTSIVHLPNPRVEREEHYYNAKHQKLLDLGLQPHLLGDTLIESVIETVEAHAHRVDPVELQQPNVNWRSGGTPGWDTPADRDKLRPVVLVSADSKRRRPAKPSRSKVAQTR